jgi:hypothetical protein
MSSIIYNYNSSSDIKSFPDTKSSFTYFNNRLYDFVGLFESYMECLSREKSPTFKQSKTLIDFFRGKYKLNNKIYRYSFCVDDYNIIISNLNKTQNIIMSNVHNHPIQKWKVYLDILNIAEGDFDESDDEGYSEQSDDSDSDLDTDDNDNYLNTNSGIQTNTTYNYTTNVDYDYTESDLNDSDINNEDDN